MNYRHAFHSDLLSQVVSGWPCIESWRNLLFGRLKSDSASLVRDLKSWVGWRETSVVAAAAVVTVGRCIEIVG